MLKDKVNAAIQDIRPMLQADGGDIEVVSVSDDGKVEVKMQGACGTCPMALFTVKETVERMLKEAVPEVTEVVPIGLM